MLACYGPKDRNRELAKHWRALFDSLRDEFKTNAEANYEYTRLGQQDYVRIPWQIYLIQAAARLFPLTRFNTWGIQSKLRSVVEAVASTKGFRYEASGPYLSTRTHACIYQALHEIDDFNLSKPLPSSVIKLISVISRIATSVLFRYSVIATMVIIGGISVALWLTSDDGRLSELAPNLVAEVILALVLWLGIRLQRAR